MKKILAFVAVSVLLATQAFAAYLPFTNEDGDTYVNNVYTTTVNGVQISDNVAIYVTKTGNDTTGDGTLANPYLTIGKGLEELVNWVSPNTMLLHIGAGTYTENVNVPRELAGVVDIQGDSSNPDNVVISAANPNLPALTISGTAKFYLRGIKVQGATNTYGVFVDRGDLTIFYCKFYNNQYGVSAYNNSKINFVYTSTGASSIDGNNIGSSYGILADFNSVMNIGQAITISNVAIGVYNRTSTTYLSAASTITASMTVWRSEKDSYNNIQGVQTLTGTSTASGRSIFYLAQSEMDFSGATLNMSTSYYGFYGFTGVKIIDSGTTYSYTNITVPAYFDYDTVLDVTGTPLGTTTSYYKAAAEYGYDALFPYADATNLNQACSTTSSPTFVSVRLNEASEIVAYENDSYTLTTALSSGGSLTNGNDYSYRLELVTSEGTTYGGGWGDNVITISSPNNSVLISNIPIGSSRVISRKLWRNNDTSGSDPRLIATFNERTTTTFLDDGTINNGEFPDPLDLQVWYNTTYDAIKRDGMDYILRGQITTTLGDDETIDNLPVTSYGSTVPPGWGEIMVGNNEEFARFRWSADGTVTLMENTANVVNTDTDNKFCIYDAGSSVAFKNRLGTTKTVKYVIKY